LGIAERWCPLAASWATRLADDPSERSRPAEGRRANHRRCAGGRIEIAVAERQDGIPALLGSAFHVVRRDVKPGCPLCIGAGQWTSVAPSLAGTGLRALDAAVETEMIGVTLAPGGARSAAVGPGGG